MMVNYTGFFNFQQKNINKIWGVVDKKYYIKRQIFYIITGIIYKKMDKMEINVEYCVK